MVGDMVTGLLTFLIIFCICLAIASVSISAQTEIRKLQISNSKMKAQIVDLQLTQSKVDSDIRNLRTSKSQPFTMNYKSVSGDMDIMRNGYAATVKATFRPDRYA